MNLKSIFENNDEKPLDNIPADGGYTAIFRTIACVGDSLSSGEFEADNGNGGSSYHDMFEYSWGQFMGRYWNPKYAAQCYIIALGVNDLLCQKQELGSPGDITVEDKKTFAHYYAEIIEKYKKIQPRAKFFLMAMPSGGEKDGNLEIKKKYLSLLNAFAEKYDNTYVLDLFNYAPEYNAQFKEKFYLRGHLNPAGYLLTAKMTAAYIDYIIRHNMKDFKEIGFIGTNLHE